MPNTGRPSLDCHLCRKRRVKCDLARPGCKRCEKYGVDCPGYRDQSQLVFRNVFPARKRNADSANVNERGDSSDSVANSSTTSTINGHTSTSTSSQALIPTEWMQHGSLYTDSAVMSYIGRPLVEHWTSHSVPILLNVYQTIDFLHDAFGIQCHDGPLLWAAHLFTRTYVTNLRYPTSISHESSNEARSELAMYMSKTLSAVSQILATPQGALRDDVLATVWILASYEILVGSLSRTRRSQDLSPWDIHTRGLYNILKARGTSRLQTEKDRAAFWPSYNMVQIQALVSHTECPPEGEEWLTAIEGGMDKSDGLALRVTRFINEVTQVVSRILQIINSGNFAAAGTEYMDLWTNLTTAERRLNNWIDAQPAFEHEFDPYMRNMQYSAIITGYHVMQLLANLMTHLPACPLPVEQVYSHRRYCLQSIQVASRSVIDNVPYAMGPLAQGRDKSPRVLFDALKLVWPLSAIYIVPTARPEHKVAAEKVLEFIGKEVGVLQALYTKPGWVDLPVEVLVPRDAGERLGVPFVLASSQEFDLGIE